MKKTICFLLSIIFVVNLFSVNVKANGLETKYLQVSVNGTVKNYECLWDSEKIYCSIKDLAEITGYDYMQLDELSYDFFREHESSTGGDIIELKTGVSVKADNKTQTASIDAMGTTYSVGYYMNNRETFLPFEEMLYLLHARWNIGENNVVNVIPLSLTILDFFAIYGTDLQQIASKTEDVLIDTGWIFSDNKIWQSIYSSVAEVFSDFDGKIFMAWWPDEGNLETAECYENAILQLAREDKEIVGENVQIDALEAAMTSAFALNNEYINKIENNFSLPGNISDIVQSIPDAVSFLEGMSEEYPDSKILEKVRNVSKKIEDGEIDSSFLKIPELESKAKEFEEIGDGLDILQCVWNAYDVAARVDEWDSDYLEQLRVLTDYKVPEYINKNVERYVRSSAQRLVDSYEAPGKAAVNEAIQSTLGLLFSKIYDESPFGKAFSILGTVGSTVGLFAVDFSDTYNVYAELSEVSFSIKIEQLVRELFRYENILTTERKLTDEDIENARNQLMLYLRLNLRNKARLYDLNIRGNQDKNWINSEEAKELHNEIVKVYVMLAELIETKGYDSLLILDTNLKNIYAERQAISEEILSDSSIENEEKTIASYWLGKTLGEYSEYVHNDYTEGYLGETGKYFVASDLSTPVVISEACSYKEDDNLKPDAVIDWVGIGPLTDSPWLTEDIYVGMPVDDIIELTGGDYKINDSEYNKMEWGCDYVIMYDRGEYEYFLPITDEKLSAGTLYLIDVYGSYKYNGEKTMTACDWIGKTFGDYKAYVDNNYLSEYYEGEIGQYIIDSDRKEPLVFSNDARFWTDDSAINDTVIHRVILDSSTQASQLNEDLFIGMDENSLIEQVSQNGNVYKITDEHYNSMWDSDYMIIYTVDALEYYFSIKEANSLLHIFVREQPLDCRILMCVTYESLFSSEKQKKY